MKYLVVINFQNASLYAMPLNTHIPWDTLPVEVVREMRPWPKREDGTLRRAGVSGFGLSGTNAHVIIEEPPGFEVQSVASESSGPLPLVISAKSPQALRDQAQRWARWLEEHSETDWNDLISAAALNRMHLKNRAALRAQPSRESWAPDSSGMVDCSFQEHRH